MTAERWERIKEIFAEAIQSPAAGQRLILDSRCGADRELRQEVENLIGDHYAASDSFLRVEPLGSAGSAADLPQLDDSAIVDGRYRIERLLGSGGFGDVYLARDLTLLSRPVVVKSLRAGASEPRAAAKFRGEMEALARIRHPGVVNLLGMGEHEGRPYLVMEYIEGVTLRSRMAGQPLPADEVKWIVAQIAAALEAAHSERIVHRDLKPENVMLTRLNDGAEIVKVIDFGVARVLQPEGATRASTVLAGTIGYIAPEQVVGRATPVSDIYSLAVIAWEMLTGKHPMEQDWAAEGTPLAALNWIRGAMAIDPDRRPASARLFAEGLNRALSVPRRPRKRLLIGTAALALQASKSQGPRAMLHARNRLWFALAVVPVVFGAGAFVVNGRLFESQFSRLTSLTQVAIPAEVLFSPVLAPDSRHLYYASNRDGGRLRISRQGLEGADAQVLTPAQWDSYDLDLSPDGNWLAYYSSREGGGVYQQPATGGPEVLIAPMGRSPRFSPDGKKLLFWVEDSNTRFGKVFARRLSREPHLEEPRQITGAFEDAHNPQWTPDGRVLICGTLRSNVKEMEHDLWIVPAAGVGAAVKTGILPYLGARGIDLHPRAFRSTSFQFYEGSLIFAGVRGHRTSLYALRLSGAFQPSGEPIPLREDADSQDNPSLRGDQLAFNSLRSSLSVWGIPLGPDGLPTGEARRLTDGAQDQVFPAVSAEGRQLVYLAIGSGASQIRRKDLTTGLESELYRGEGINRLKASLDGSRAFFRVMDGPAPQFQEIHSIDVKGGEVRKVCSDCGAPTSASPSGDYVVHETGHAVSRLAVIHVPSGEKREVLRHPHHGVQAGRISPDGRWIAFELDRGHDGIQLFTASFKGLEPILESEWTPVSDPSASSFEPAWSPDGSALYFLSNRDGPRDLWMQRLRPDKRAFGAPALVHRFSDPHLTPLTYHFRPSRYVGLSIAAHQAVLTLSELSSSIWLGRLSR